MEEWRLIDSGIGGAAYNMALDEALTSSVRANGSPPCLRFYGWDRKSLSIGYFQKTAGIDRDYCEALGVAIVRRPTGGRAVFHSDELTYSISAPAQQLAIPGGLLQSYKKIGEAFALAFRKIGIAAEPRKTRESGRVLAGNPLCFGSTSYAEILVAGKKIMGSAQKRWTDGFLQQGSIPFSGGTEEIYRVFGMEAGRNGSSPGLRNWLPSLTERELKEAVALSFEEAFGVRFCRSRPTAEEEAHALELRERKYLRPEWNFQR